MVGRAGRYGFDIEADSYICIPKSKVFNEKKAAFDLMNKDKMEYIKSCFANEKKGLSRIILDSIGTQLVLNQDDLKTYLESTLMYQQGIMKFKEDQLKDKEN